MMTKQVERSNCRACMTGVSCARGVSFGGLRAFPMPSGLVGSVLEGHRHHKDHVTFLGHGAVRVTAHGPDGEVTQAEFTAPACIEIPAEVWHEFERLVEDTTLFCVFREDVGDTPLSYQPILSRRPLESPCR